MTLYVHSAWTLTSQKKRKSHTLMTVQVTYRGDAPAPRREHGEEIPNYGRVQRRSRIHEGWEYRCWNEQHSCFLYYFESDLPSYPAARKKHA